MTESANEKKKKNRKTFFQLDFPIQHQFDSKSNKKQHQITNTNTSYRFRQLLTYNRTSVITKETLNRENQIRVKLKKKKTDLMK